jgi:YVTN family beta-propeller protein
MLKAALAAIAIVTGVVAAAEPGEVPRNEVLFLRTNEGITLLQTSPTRNVVRFPDAISSTDWSAVVQTAPAGADTRVMAFDSSSGRQLWSREVDGRHEAKVASPGAEMVALGNPRGQDGYLTGRSHTTLMILEQGVGEARAIQLAGNYEPEAFSTDGQSLFVVEYLPPMQPTRYRVRRLDLKTERVVGVYTVDAELQEAMEGTARVQAASPDGRRLYTLYTVDDGRGTPHAFVHVLDLDELWAHCVDLPHSFGRAPEQTIGISVAPDGKHLYAADTSTGTVAEIDTTSLAVTRTVSSRMGPSRGGVAHAAVAGDGTFYVAKGLHMTALDPATLSTRDTWEMESRITGIQPASQGARVYIGLKDQIVILDPTTGDRLGMLDPGGDERIDRIGTATQPLEMLREVITCAC